MHLRLVASALLLATLAVPAQAEWKGKGEVGIVFARGNSETETGNVKLDMAKELERWKHGFGIAALRSSSEDVLTAERYGANWQSDFKINDRSFWFGGLRYEQDEFSGFDHQASATTGYGYKFIDREGLKLSGQLGAGYRRSKNAVTLATDGEGIVTGQLAYEHQLTATTKLLDKLVVEAGSDNTFASNELSLQVSMTERLALSFGIGVRYNSDPPAGLKSTDTLTTVNLVVAL
jgi:putative salt-induced outer membrane protein